MDNALLLLLVILVLCTVTGAAIGRWWVLLLPVIGWNTYIIAWKLWGGTEGGRPGENWPAFLIGAIVICVLATALGVLVRRAVAGRGSWLERFSDFS